MFGIGANTVIGAGPAYPDPDLYMTTGVNKPSSSLTFGYQVPTFQQAMAQSAAQQQQQQQAQMQLNAGRNTVIIVVVALGLVLLAAAATA